MTEQQAIDIVKRVVGNRPEGMDLLKYHAATRVLAEMYINQKEAKERQNGKCD